MTRNPRLLVLTLSFGSGHARAAAAVADALRRQDPAADVRVVDVLADCRFPFRAAYVWPYWAMVRYAPAVWKRLFESRLRRISRRTAPEWVFRWGCAKTFQAIAGFEPDVMIAVEVAACEIAAIARRRALTQAALVNVITDRHAEPAWVQPEVAAYAAADSGVLRQLRDWGAPADRIVVSGIPIDTAFHPVHAECRGGVPVVLLMGGGMGPTRMDRVAAELVKSGVPMQIVAVTGHDRRARRRVARVRPVSPVALSLLGWTDAVPELMNAAAVLVTKPGGLTTAEAAACGLPMVLFDAIPGPEQHNAATAVAAGAAIMTRGADETAAAVLSLLRNELHRSAMIAGALRLAQPDAAGAVARLALDARQNARRPVLILTISNGAGHTSVAHAIAEELRATHSTLSPLVVDVADYMTAAARFTHVTAYVWLVKHAPALWALIDRYQKRQPRTSPEWYYRRGCRRLFALARQLNPAALVATEVGCGEIAALIKRDLVLDCPLIAVNGEYDTDRAWMQPEVDVYCAATAEAVEELSARGPLRPRLHVIGVPIAREFRRQYPRAADRSAVCRRLKLDPQPPFLLVSGGSEGLGHIDAVVRRLLRLQHMKTNVVVLAGRNERLKAQCERLDWKTTGHHLRVLGWTTDTAELMRAADLMISKLGHTFDEALASGLPIVALEPPPGSERVQYRLLDAWGVGRAVATLDEMAAAVEHLLAFPSELATMRSAARLRQTPDAAQHIAALVAAEGLRP